MSAELGSRFPLPWSHYVRLLRLDNPFARRFYEAEALRGGWTVSQLQRQIDSQYYERAARSRNKDAILAREYRLALPEEETLAEEIAKARRRVEGAGSTAVTSFEPPPSPPAS